MSLSTGYQSDVTTTLPSGLPICVAPPATNPTREPAQAKTSAQPVSRIKPGSKTPEQPKNSKTSFQPSSKTSPKSPATITRNYGPGDGIFEYRDSMFDEGISFKPCCTKQISIRKLYL